MNYFCNRKQRKLIIFIFLNLVDETKAIFKTKALTAQDILKEFVKLSIAKAPKEEEQQAY